MLTVLLAALCGCIPHEQGRQALPVSVAVTPLDAGKAPPERAKPSPTIDDWLADDAPSRFPSRCRIRMEGAIQLLAHSKPQGPSEPSPLAGHHAPIVVVEERTDRLRVVLEDSRARIVAFVPRSHLVRVPVAVTPLFPGNPPLEPEAGTGVRLAPGVDLEDAGSAVFAGIAMREVHGEVEHLSVRGWIQESALGDVWVDAPFARPTSTGRLRQGAALSVPGRSLGAQHGELRRALAVRVPPPSAGASAVFLEGVEALGGGRVRLVRPSIELVGDVDASDYQATTGGDGLWSDHYFESSGGYDMHARRAVVREGAPLFAPGTDVKIGVARKETQAFFHTRASPRMQVQLSFGPLRRLSVDVESADLGLELSP